MRFWDLTTRRSLGSLDAGDRVVGAACSPDGRWLATVSQVPSGLAGVNPVQLRDPATRTRAAVVHRWARSAIAFSPNSKLLAFFDGEHGLVVLWDIAQRHQIAEMPVPYDYMGPLAIGFSPMGDLLAYSAGGESGAIVGTLMCHRLTSVVCWSISRTAQ